ncbi:hypothetical protein ACLIIZ_09820 [Azonexus caeni]|jgi:hypothetical protein|uniref:hypothetical protein n=1 Tax=Azonexus caeni TaxID=266126 RepID=UPI003A853825
MNPWLYTLAALAGIVGAWLLYLAVPQQQWLAAPRRPARGLAWSGAALALLALLLLLTMMGAMAAVATWLSLLMLVGTLAPFLGAWRAHRRRRPA